jgi:hypothetical protein
MPWCTCVCAHRAAQRALMPAPPAPLPPPSLWVSVLFRSRSKPPLPRVCLENPESPLRPLPHVRTPKHAMRCSGQPAGRGVRSCGPCGWRDGVQVGCGQPPSSPLCVRLCVCVCELQPLPHTTHTTHTTHNAPHSTQWHTPQWRTPPHHLTSLPRVLPPPPHTHPPTHPPTHKHIRTYAHTQACTAALERAVFCERGA